MDYYGVWTVMGAVIIIVNHAVEMEKNIAKPARVMGLFIVKHAKVVVNIKNQSIKDKANGNREE
jgi:hypothetical protein